VPPWKTYYRSCPHGKRIFLVSGTHVRDVHDSDFSQGGNGYRYAWIPKSELWVDASIPEVEWPFIIDHECQEAELMSRGMSYDRAHTRAKRTEDKARRGETTMRRLTVAETREATYNVQLAADILQHPRVTEMNFAIPSANIARVLREVVARLKQRSRALSADEVAGITHALQVGADYLQNEHLTTLPLFPGREDCAKQLLGIAARIKTLRGKS
jgi:hypothetical protein